MFFKILKVLNIIMDELIEVNLYNLYIGGIFVSDVYLRFCNIFEINIVSSLFVCKVRKVLFVYGI